ncbi:hypothetical protein PBI_SCTP2_251 [Salicola phage SCTP-2]|nr:hypothetical protein PBI_SCTP2_251 [Salicola phage SCTP-2]
MGGSFSDTTERFDQKTHDKLFEIVQNAFSQIGMDCRVIPYLESKETFGDVDTVVRIDNDECDIDSYTHQVYDVLKQQNHNIRIENDNVVTSAPHFRVLVIDGHQIDINYINKNKSEIYRMFFAYNGLNIILNKILSNNHMRFSLNGGLKINLNTLYEINDPSNDFYHYIPIEKVEIEDLIRLAQLDYKKYERGFKDFEDIFDWFEQSPLYTAKIITKYNLNAKKRREIRNNRIIRVGYERYNDEDFEKEPETISFDRFVKFIDDNFPNEKGSHLQIMDEIVKKFTLERDVKRIHRDTKDFIIDRLRKQFRPNMTNKEFNYKYLSELYKYNYLNADDSIQTIIETVAKQFHD